MADISIIEFIVYGFVAYSSLLMLIISSIRENPVEKSQSITRTIWLIPGIFASYILASSHPNIIYNETTNTIINLNTTEVWTETITIQNVLLNPVWVSFHFMIFIVLLFFVILQMVSLFVKIK